MPPVVSKHARILLLCAALVLGAGGAWFVRARRQPPQTVVTTQPSTLPATHPATQAATPAPPRDYMDVVLRTHPDFPTTQPLSVPLDLSEAARIVFDDSVHLDPVGQLWITRADAEPTPAVLKAATTQLTHVTRERVVFVHRWPDEKGVWQPFLIVKNSHADGVELIQVGGRQPLGSTRNYDWERAFSWNEVIVVPTETGISIIRPDRRPLELHHEFQVEATGPRSAPQLLLDWRGLIGWMPWDSDKSGSHGAVRFVNEQWIDLNASRGWPEKLIQLVPLLDGSILQMHATETGDAVLSMVSLDPPAADAGAIEVLVERLSDADPERRDAAFAELTRYGAGAWPVLEKLSPDQPPEGKRRIEDLLTAKQQPTLGGLTLLPGEVRTIARSTGGASMLLADAGVSIPRGDDEPQIVAPAWLMILPGRPIQLASADLMRDFVPGRTVMTIIGREVLVSDEVQGPRLWLSNHFSRPLLKKDQLDFAAKVVGFDARGRWLFRRSTDPDGPTLVIDPTLPDPTPRLPVWNYPVAGGVAGWTKENWPAIKRGGAWVLTDKGWRAMDESKSQLIVETPDDATTSPATTQSATPILTDADGTKYFDGRESLHIVRADGTEFDWALPPGAIGRSEVVWLLRAGDDRLFLFNSPGRVLRIRSTPGGSEPFQLESTFTRRIPSSDRLIRVWVDPAGRINMIAEPDHLLIMFPTGHIPGDIAEMMPAEELKAAEEQ
jgi:hypothetical protein